jgi:hypothetical protein
MEHYRGCSRSLRLGENLCWGEYRFFWFRCPCGNCRQIWKDYAPDAQVIFSKDGRLVKTTMRQYLPDA